MPFLERSSGEAISFPDRICCLRKGRDIFSQPVLWSRIPRINLGKFVLRCWGHQVSEAAVYSVRLSTKSLEAASCLWHRCNLRSTRKRDFWNGHGCSTSVRLILELWLSGSNGKGDHQIASSRQSAMMLSWMKICRSGSTYFKQTWRL